MRERANLKPARGVTNWRNRGETVRRALVDTANRSQASLKTFLTQRGAKTRSFFIANALRVEADQATIDAIAKRSDVARVVPDRVYAIPPVDSTPGVLTTEWGLDSIRVPEAWAAFGLKGEGIVVANIDTGAQFDHPALAAQYRGNNGGGSIDHNYNWFDPSHICGPAANGPCDNAGHGTHTMGTMVGDDGDPGPNQVGVAPHAKWIAAKGCEDFSCSFEALLSSAEWILAPTDLNGANPRADLRPNIVNNSWGGWGGDPFFQDAVDAWVAAGIFPVFSAGNSGPFCQSAGSPGDYLNSYAVGAYDEFGQIAEFSSRGPSAFGGGKPNIAAPGVFVRSSVPGNQYDFFSGTSMAAPHLAGTIALMWSAAPALVGDIDGTRALLDSTAVDTEDLSCGGTAENNNVWGEGRLDAFAAIDAAPRGPTGTLAGAVTSGNPIVGAVIRATDSDGRVRSATTGAPGTYSLRLPIGSFDVTATAFGYLTQNVNDVVINQDATTTQDFALVLAPAHPVTGTVVDDGGAPIARAVVSVVGTPIATVRTDAGGHYTIPSVPEGEYEIAVAPSRCFGAQTQPLVVDGDEVVDFALDARVDAYGYSCDPVEPAYVQASTIITENSDYTAFTATLPFPFTYYGVTYSSLSIGTDGFVSFQPMQYSDGWNVPIPEPFQPNAAIYANWDDLFVADGGSIRTDVVGSAPNRTFVIEWRDVQSWEGSGELLSFEILLNENGSFALQYGNATTTGARATIGIEDQNGAVGLQYSFDEASVDDQTAILYTLPPSGIVRGVVTDFNDGLPIVGAAVSAFNGATLVRAARTDAQGRYQVQVPVGAYTLSASRDRYNDATTTLNVAQDQIYTANFALKSARAVVTPATVQLTTTANQVRHRTLTLSNTGSVDLNYEISEAGGARQQIAATRSLKRVAGADLNATTTRELFVHQSGTPNVRGWRPNAPGDVLSSFSTPTLELPWGVGYTGNLWISDPFLLTNTEFTVAGALTGRTWNPTWGEWAGDMAYDGSRNIVCQVAVGGDNGIHCFEPDTGNEVETITGSFPWTMISQRGLAYRGDDDTFYIGGWNEGIIYHVAGLSHPQPGAVIDQCTPSDGAISGLTWNDSMQVLWAATNSETDTIYELNPSDCTVLATLAHPEPGFNGAGLEMDEAGNLWLASQNTREVFLLDSGVPAFSDVPWLSVTPTSGSLAPGASRALDVTIDTAGLQPGIYLASLFVRSNSGRESAIRIPVSLVVSAYIQAANSGGAAYTDATGDTWAADKAHANGSWGYVQKGSVVSTTKKIAGTVEQKLYNDARQDPYAYRYDSVPNGIYEIDMRFAELANVKLGKRLYDVIVENTLVLPAHDIVYEVGTLTADNHSFFVEVTDGRLDVRLVPRAKSEKPLINAIRVTHRPDR